MKISLKRAAPPANFCRYALVSLIGFVGACATQPDTIVQTAAEIAPAQVAAEAPAAEAQFTSTATLAQTDLICTRERLTGTKMKRNVCKTAEEREKDHAAAALFVRTKGRFGGVKYVHMMDIATGQ